MGQRGEAGRAGDDVRSDAHVAVELGKSGGLKLDVTSKVDAFFGEAIRKSAEQALATLGVEHAEVAIDDKGALPFVLQARIEAAVRRAGVVVQGDARPERTVSPPRSARDRLRRSRLYLPGNEPKFMVNAGLHHPDAVILDLEDSVHPAEKDTARLLVRNALRCIDFLGAERMVRINQIPLGLEDLEVIVPEAPDLILIPKTEEPGHVRQVVDRIGQIQHDAGGGEPIWLMPILESARGVEYAFAIADASDTVAALTIGSEW
jgi:citrate lyase subunit beta/citryl-CoA lyase